MNNVKLVVKLGEVEIEKQEFHFSKKAIVVDDVDVDKVIMSDEFLI